MFVNNDEICDIVCSTGCCKFFDNIVPAIYSMRIGED